MPMSDPHPYTPDEALLGGEGVVQAGQSGILGRVPADTLVGSQNPPSFQRETTLVQAECEDKYGRMLTLVLSAKRKTPPATPEQENEILPAFALVSFGNGGTQSEKQLQVDFINGAMFNVPAAFLRVDAVLEASVPDNTQEAIDVSVFAGYLPMGRTRSAQRTRQLGVIADAASQIIPIPFFTSRVEVLGNVLGATYEIEELADAAGAVVLFAAAIPSPAPVRTIPLANAARYVRITNTSGVPVDTRATFQLTV